MYYVIETKYVGPNQGQDQYIDADKIQIRTTAAIANSSRDERIEGWCGTNNDLAVYAHGEYATIEEARAAIFEKFGDVRDCYPNGDRFESNDCVVEIYKFGKFEPMSSEATEDWVCKGIQADIHADTTDERIAELIFEYGVEVNSNGYALHSDLEDFMKRRRHELLEEREGLVR